jgi:WD40 repeat protein
MSYTSTNVMETATGKNVATFRGESSGATFTPDGRRLLTSSDNGITIYDVRGFNELASLPMAAWTMSFSPDGQRLAV